MIIWINGAFGVGKTQAAHELHSRLPGSHVYNPEEIGFALHKTFPGSLKSGDFQDIPLWRLFNHQALKELARHGDQTLIVPMTLAVPQYFREVVGALREDGVEVYHFTLFATKQTILRRLRGRGDGPNSWPVQQLERCLTALQSREFATHVHADSMTVPQVAEVIAERVGVRLEPAQNPLRAGLRRLTSQIRPARR
ncbi:MAG: AAA family ATPase [Meiothermus sp.]|nr:AAA family ATPase [Meiothermus sp.]